MQIQNLETLVAGRHFKIESDRAYPQSSYAMQQVLNSGIMQPGSSSGTINLIGNSNFLKVSGDSISSYLPYFGERQMQVAYGGGDATIQLNGLVRNYQVKKNEKHGGYTISFEADSHAERFRVVLELFPNLKSEIRLSGASRHAISYSGQLSSVKE
ncbi:DUF4251 domain-containing protein [Mariniflexile ostreae]|uniref:DUF4251 domain-containing protein n=2 Tax=Mariniflexile ostreae TaxID=1520892 RepID=A0ABV5FDX9_9FLAO